MKLAWSDPAIADRHAIYAYIEAENPRAALVLDERFRKAAEMLSTQPFLGRPGRVSGTREFVVSPRYILVYEVTDEALTVLAVLHTSRQWPPLIE